MNGMLKAVIEHTNGGGLTKTNNNEQGRGRHAFHLVKKKKLKKRANYALQHVTTDTRCMWMKSVLNLT